LYTEKANITGLFIVTLPLNPLSTCIDKILIPLVFELKCRTVNCLTMVKQATRLIHAFTFSLKIILLATETGL